MQFHYNMASGLLDLQKDTSKGFLQVLYRLYVNNRGGVCNTVI